MFHHTISDTQRLQSWSMQGCRLQTFNPMWDTQMQKQPSPMWRRSKMLIYYKTWFVPTCSSRTRGMRRKTIKLQPKRPSQRSLWRRKRSLNSQKKRRNKRRYKDVRRRWKSWRVGHQGIQHLSKLYWSYLTGPRRNDKFNFLKFCLKFALFRWTGNSRYLSTLQLTRFPIAHIQTNYIFFFSKSPSPSNI
jgi:hypothetical protein